jgi:hypothetical protein
MDRDGDDMNRATMLDGNGVGAMLHDVFAAEMTASPTECAHCGRHEQIGELLAFTEAPGLVLRCPACEDVMVRVVQTPEFTYLDARGAVYLRMARSAR